jgi:uncharacterized membrane protein
LGVSAGFVAAGVVSMFIRWKNPKYAKQQEINMNDERNIQIYEKAGHSAFVITMFSLVALIITMLALEQIMACALVCAFGMMPHTHPALVIVITSVLKGLNIDSYLGIVCI